ncbi:MAG: type II secretion system protein, partial [Candidatus Saccharimonadales bacterium]
TGFTIIEVVLVLAIAALIFLIVFLAVPALQRSQRDTQRRSDVTRLSAALSNYIGNHGGSLPTITSANAAQWVFINVRASRVSDRFEDPRGNTTYYSAVSNGTQYNVTVDTTATTTAPVYSATNNPISIRFGQVCDPNGVTSTVGAGSRSYAVVMALESGDTACSSR